MQDMQALILKLLSNVWPLDCGLSSEASQELPGHPCTQSGTNAELPRAHPHRCFQVQQQQECMKTLREDIQPGWKKQPTGQLVPSTGRR